MSKNEQKTRLEKTEKSRNISNPDREKPARNIKRGRNPRPKHKPETQTKPETQPKITLNPY